MCVWEVGTGAADDDEDEGEVDEGGVVSCTGECVGDECIGTARAPGSGCGGSVATRRAMALNSHDAMMGALPIVVDVVAVAVAVAGTSRVWDGGG